MRASLALAALLAACAAPAPDTHTFVAEIPIEVLKPGGTGPFAAVVLLHDCSGLGPRSSGGPRRWARELVSRGYVVAIPDSFSTRGFPNGVCVDPNPKRQEVSPIRRARDVYDALDHLRSLPYVDKSRIGVMGASHGGSATLAALHVYPRDDAALAERKRHGFAAAIALYPGCVALPYKPHAPLLILVGELDDWTPAEPCVQLVQRVKQAGLPADIKVYPGAHHSFDSVNPVRYVAERVNANAPGGRGATTGGNADAWADSILEVEAFFARHLAPGRR